MQDLAKLQKVAAGLVYSGYLTLALAGLVTPYEIQVAQLCPGIFQEGWLAYLKELGTPIEHKA